MGDVERQETGLLDVLADVALHQEEFEGLEEAEFEESPQEMEEDEKAPHDNQGAGETSSLSKDTGNGVHHHYACDLTFLGYSRLTVVL